MTPIRRYVIRAVLGLLTAVAVGLMGASTAAAQTTPDGDIAWSAPSDIAW